MKRRKRETLNHEPTAQSAYVNTIYSLASLVYGNVKCWLLHMKEIRLALIVLDMDP